MAYVRVTPDEARAAKDFDQATIDSTTEEEIARFNAEDGFDPEDTLKGFREILQPAAVRAKIGMSQAAFARALASRSKRCANGSRVEPAWIRRLRPF